MLFFKCRLSFNEVVALEKQLPGEVFCVSRDPVDQYHYGVVKPTAFSQFLNVLSGETLEQLEYLSDEEFQQALSIMRRKKVALSGNRELLNE